MQIFKNPNYDFMRYKYIAIAISLVIIAVGVLNIFGGKGMTSGIDFAGGALIQVRFKTPFPIGELRNSLTTSGIAGSKITVVGEGNKEFIIRAMLPEADTEQELEVHEIIGNRIIDILRTNEDRTALAQGLMDLNNVDVDELTALLSLSVSEEYTPLLMARRVIDLRESEEQAGILESFDQLNIEEISKDVIDVLEEKTYLGSLAVKRRETVGPQVGRDLRRKATQATIWALIGMLIYIGIRFKFAYGVSAILTLAHDVLITLGIFSLTNREMNLPVIAAILTIVGYSLNDTIVIFDRVRDNLKTMRKHDFQTILNTSLNQTLSRSIITSGTTFLTVLALFLFGGEVINDFAFTMMIGVIIGSYSSIYQSCPLLYFWKKIFKPKKGLGR